jgi:hypothetical protein
MKAIPLYLALGLALSAAPAMAQSDAGTAAPVAASAVDPKAVAALERMGAYLRTLKQFSVHGDSTFDVVGKDGQKLQFPGTVDYKVRAPNGLTIQLKTDRKDRQLFFDGKHLTVYGPKAGYYATVDAPPTIRELLATAEDDYGIELPLVDLFLWGTDKAPTSSLTSATFVGPARINGTATDQYAFRQNGVDWQVWIEPGSKPLPRRMVITTTDDPAMPQYASTLTWNTSATFNDSNFNFTPPKDAKRIELVKVAVVEGADQEAKP